MPFCRFRSTGFRATRLRSWQGWAAEGWAAEGWAAEGWAVEGVGPPSSSSLHAGGLPYGLHRLAEVVFLVNETSSGRKRRPRGSRPAGPRQVGAAAAEPPRAALPPAGPSRAATQAMASPRASGRAASRKAVARQFARASARIERSSEYRRSLQVVLELGGELERLLEPAQRERWLALEDALLDHSARLYRAYFRAGLKYGLQRPAEDRLGGPGAGSAGGDASGLAKLPSAAQLELLAAFARLIGLC